jgi:hypothetical protein
MTQLLQSVTVDGRDIQRLIYDRLAPAVEGEPLSHAVLSMLTFAVLLMRPSIELEKLQEVVMAVSEHMVLAMGDPSNTSVN